MARRPIQWSTEPELNRALQLDAQKLCDQGVEGYSFDDITEEITEVIPDMDERVRAMHEAGES